MLVGAACQQAMPGWPFLSRKVISRKLRVVFEGDDSLSSEEQWSCSVFTACILPGVDLCVCFSLCIFASLMRALPVLVAGIDYVGLCVCAMGLADATQ